MIFKISADNFPFVNRIYTVTRNNTWEAIDSSHILLFVYNGTCKIKIGNQTNILNPGDCIFIPKNTLYTRTSVNNTSCTMYYAHFILSAEKVSQQEAVEGITSTIEKLNQAIIDTIFSPPKYNWIYITSTTSLKEQREELKAEFENAITVFHDFELYSPLYASIAVSKILLNIANSVHSVILGNKNNLSREIPKKLQKAILYIQENYNSKHITLNTLCEVCSISHQQLTRYFKTYFGTTPMAYVNRYKIDKSCELLQNAVHLSIKEISKELGFEDQCYFTRIFTKTKGESPSAFRKRVAIPYQHYT